MLTIQHLTKHYPGSTDGVTDLTLHVPPGAICAFIGHNGAGKTTTLKAIAGIHGFDRGDIRIDGISLSADPLACKRLLAYIPDDPDLYPYLTGIQYLNFIADVFQVDAPTRQSRIADLGGQFALTPALGDLISTYSHGMKQKLAILAALLHDPKLLVLDEPFVGLDPQAAVTVKGLMRDLCARGGAVFFSTHVLDVAQRLCDQVAILKDGRLVAAGPMDALVREGQTLEDLFLEVAAHEP